jgi:hypothetical protein
MPEIIQKEKSNFVTTAEKNYSDAPKSYSPISNLQKLPLLKTERTEENYNSLP